MPVWLAPILLAASFAVLAKGAGWLVDGAVGIAERFNVPKFLIGLVLVGLATTAPEFAVSITSAIQGIPEMALGNAVGSVIVDDGVALGLVGILAAAPVVVSRRLVAQAAVFLAAIDAAAFVLVVTHPVGGDFVLTRWGGGLLLALFAAYMGYLVWDRVKHPGAEAAVPGEAQERGAGRTERGLAGLVGLFLLGLGLVIGSSHVIVPCATLLADAAGMSKAVMGLTVVAIGTSIPEIATCVAATRKGHGALAVGDIIGADVLNISWIAGASAVANPLVVAKKDIFFMFPSMLAIVGVTLGGLILKGKMTRAFGCVLLAMYVVYMGLMVWFFPPQVS